MDPASVGLDAGIGLANPAGTLRSRTRKIDGGRTAPRPAVHAGTARPACCVLDRAHRPVRDLFERLRDGRQGRVSQARQHEIVEAGHRNVLGHAQALLAQDIDGAGRHLVVRRHDAVDLHAAREDLLHRHLGRVGAEIARGRQGRIAGDAVAGQHRLIGVEPDLRLRVLRGPRQKRDLAAAVIADEVLDHRLHAGPVVEHQARHAGQLDADAAHRGAGEPLDQPRDAARARSRSTAATRRR